MAGLDASQLIPSQANRYPCLFVDRITSLDPGHSADGVKRWSFNEWCTQASAEVPPVCVSESLEQVLLMTFLTLPDMRGCKTSTVSLSAEYLEAVHAGDTMLIHATLDSFRRGLARGTCVGRVEGEEVCKASYAIVVPTVLEKFRPSAKGGSL